MNAGIALEFKKRFYKNRMLYASACIKRTIIMRQMFVTETDIDSPKRIINFPIKEHWMHTPKMNDIIYGLSDLRTVITTLNIKSLSIPAVFSNQLNSDDLYHEINKALCDCDCEIMIFNL